MLRVLVQFVDWVTNPFNALENFRLKKFETNFDRLLVNRKVIESEYKDSIQFLKEFLKIDSTGITTECLQVSSKYVFLQDIRQRISQKKV